MQYQESTIENRSLNLFINVFRVGGIFMVEGYQKYLRLKTVPPPSPTKKYLAISLIQIAKWTSHLMRRSINPRAIVAMPMAAGGARTAPVSVLDGGAAAAVPGYDGGVVDELVGRGSLGFLVGLLTHLDV
jgi:hypothetical protein